MIYLKLRQAAELVNYKRVESLYRLEQLHIRRRRRKKLIAAERHPLLRPALANGVRSMDFVFDLVATGRTLTCLTVVDAATKRPIADVRIKYLETEFSDQVGSADGKFRSIDFSPGTKVTIQLSAPGYTNRSMRMTVSEAPIAGTIEMQQAIIGGRLAGRITAEGAGAAEASIWLSGEEERRAKVDPATGAFQIDVKPGDYRMVVSAPGHISLSENISILNGRQENSFQLRPLDAGTRLRLTGDAYEVDNADAQVSFEGDRLTADSRTLLDEVVKLLQSEASLRFIVRAHTDEQGDSTKATELTQKRAKAVVTYLTSKGIDASRLRAEGVGDAEPKFPNLSDRNRRRNNRVEFVLQGR